MELIFVWGPFWGIQEPVFLHEAINAFGPDRGDPAAEGASVRLSRD